MKMSKIDINTWQEYRIGDIFEISRPIARSSQNYEEGDTPYVASGSFNNGIQGYFTRKDENDIDLGNCITVSPVDGYAFYQQDDFLGRGGAGSSIIILRNTNLNINNGRFICTIIRKACNKWNYSNMGNKDTLADTIIKLPTKNDKPDWEYMANYMKTIISNEKNNYERLSSMSSNNNKIDISGWKRFHLYDESLFDISMGSKLDRIKMKDENPTINFVGRANANNGITTCVDKIDGIEPYPAGTLTVSLGGEYLGSCFVQPKDYYTSQNVIVLIPRWNMPYEVKQFIATMIFKESRTYYKAFIDELNRHIKTDFSFYLPVDDNGTPNWSFMEKYMKDIFSKETEKISLLNNNL